MNNEYLFTYLNYQNHFFSRFKQLEAERREEQKRELMALSKRIAMTCAPQTDEEEFDPEMQVRLQLIFVR